MNANYGEITFNEKVMCIAYTRTSNEIAQQKGSFLLL